MRMDAQSGDYDSKMAKTTSRNVKMNQKAKDPKLTL